jgi:membrane-associated phospholipid phosphatase
MRGNAIALAIGQLLLSSAAAAQHDSTPSLPRARHVSSWIVPLGIATAVAADAEIREWTLQHHSRSADRFAKPVNQLGTARLLIPAMAVTYAGALLTDRRSLAAGVINTAGAYIASDLVEATLKPVVGRERPHAGGNSHRFRPFTSDGDWHSFPSAHVAHIAAIATAISVQSHSALVDALCDGVVGLVAADRVYEDQHWTSDVAVTAALTAIVSRAAVRLVDSRLIHRHHVSAGTAAIPERR